MSEAAGTLWVVATPIGNLDDITLRALDVLRRADGIVAEDTRHTRKLCTHHGVRASITALHAHSSERAVQRCVDRLLSGQSLALVSDAGTPLVSDPGGALVQAARAAQVPVEGLPGASAVTTALSVSGIPFDAFRFAGFLPRSGSRRTRALEAIADASETTVLFEAPARLPTTLADLIRVAGPERQAAVCRELTKIHEEVVCGPLKVVSERFAGGALGEITLVIARGDSAPRRPPDADLDEIIAARLTAGDSARDVARALSARFELPRRELYARVLAVSKRQL